MIEGLLNIHLQHVGDALPLETDFERLLVESVSLTDGTRDPDVGEEIHLQFVGTVSLARLAPPARHVE